MSEEDKDWKKISEEFDKIEEQQQKSLFIEWLCMLLGSVIVAALFCWPLSFLWSVGFVGPFGLPQVEAIEFFCVSMFFVLIKTFTR